MKKITLILIIIVAILGLFITSANSQIVSKLYYAGTDTSAALSDTLSRKVSGTLNTMNGTFPTWYQVVLFVDDTVEVSTSASFTIGKTERILPGFTWTSQIFDVKFIPNLYWKRKGTGTATLEYRIFGY